MANGIPLTIGGQPSILGAFASGRQIRQQQEDREAAIAKAARLQELRTQLGQAPVDQQPIQQLGAALNCLLPVFIDLQGLGYTDFQSDGTGDN